MKIAGMLLKGLVIIYLVIFSVLNAEKIGIVFFFDKEPLMIPKFLVVVLASVAGFFFTGLYLMVEKFRLGRQISRYKKDLKAAEDEIKRLRNLPLSQNEKASKSESKPETQQKKADAEPLKEEETEKSDAEPVPGS